MKSYALCAKHLHFVGDKMNIQTSGKKFPVKRL